jgi:hypothetical protein
VHESQEIGIGRGTGGGKITSMCDKTKRGKAGERIRGGKWEREGGGGVF